MQPTAPRNPWNHEFMPEDYFSQYDSLSIFGNDKPLEVDLGCGDGSFLLDMAEHYPERNFLGVERLLGRVSKVCRQAERRNLSNLKVLRLDSKYTVEWLLRPCSVHRLHLLCPDPWPKDRHHKRRMFQVSFLEALAKIIEAEGEFCFKTDHPEYFTWSEEKVALYGKAALLPWPEDAFFYPKTDFQRQWEAEGKQIHRLRMKFLP